MLPALQELVDQIESQRISVLEPFRSLTTLQLKKIPRKEKWSAAEIFSHIIAAERLSILYMQKKALGLEMAGKSGPWEELKVWALKISQRLPALKYKAPKKVVDNTVQYQDLESIETAWKNVRRELLKFLEAFPEHGLNRLIYKHPAAGYLNVRHALIFFREHITHHQPQLKKLQAGD